MLTDVDSLGIAVLAAMLGVVGGFIAARHIDRLAARRAAYTAYVGAVEVAGWALRRRLLGIRDHPEQRPWPEMPEPGTVNGPLGEIWTVAPGTMMVVVERVQNHLRSMEITAMAPSRATAANITDLLRDFDDLREELVNLARRQTWERVLPSETFRDYPRDLVPTAGTNADGQTSARPSD